LARERFRGRTDRDVEVVCVAAGGVDAGLEPSVAAGTLDAGARPFSSTGDGASTLTRNAFANSRSCASISTMQSCTVSWHVVIWTTRLKRYERIHSTSKLDTVR
jgi:hypothetical protein